MRAFRQGVLAAVMVAALLATTSVSVCAGWTSSAEARMACCAMAGHDCSREHADDCCAAGEQRQHSEIPGALSSIAPPHLLAILTPSAPLAAAELIARAWRPRQPPDIARSSADARLLLSVFLI